MINEKYFHSEIEFLVKMCNNGDLPVVLSLECATHSPAEVMWTHHYKVQCCWHTPAAVGIFRDAHDVNFLRDHWVSFFSLFFIQGFVFFKKIS